MNKKICTSKTTSDYISDEIKRHDYYMNVLYKRMLKGKLSDKDYNRELEYERNEMGLIVKKIIGDI